MTGKDERRAAMTTDERAMTATSNDNPAKTGNDNWQTDETAMSNNR
jgi:hypothetical protein